MFWAPAATAITIMMLTLIVRAMHCKHQGIPVWNNIFQSKATLGAYFLLRSFVLVTLVRSLYLRELPTRFSLSAVPCAIRRSHFFRAKSENQAARDFRDRDFLLYLFGRDFGRSE